MALPQTQAPVQTTEKTFWERAAQTRWGRYLTSFETNALARARQLAGKAGVAIEIGCEGGRWAMELHDAGWRMICTDVNPAAIDICAKRIPEAECILVKPTDTKLPAETASIDLTITLEVWPVVMSPWYPLEAARVTKPGGLLLTAYNNPLSLRGSLYRIVQRFDKERQRVNGYGGPPYHVYRRRLEDAGFEILEETALGWFPFTRMSNSPLIPPCLAIENALRLRRYPRFGPIVLTLARRK